MAADLLRTLRADEITCPAGKLSGDAGCYCTIEDGLIDGRKSPESLTVFCAGDYKACPTWQLEKDRIAENKKARSYLEEERKRGERIRSRARDVRESRLERARHLLFGNSEEARRFRARIGVKARIRGERVEIDRAA